MSRFSNYIDEKCEYHNDKKKKKKKKMDESVKNYKDIVKKYNVALNNWRSIIKLLEADKDKSYKKDADKILNMMKKLGDKIQTS